MPAWVLLLVVSACGDNAKVNGGAPDASLADARANDAADPCPALALGSPRLQFNLGGQLTGLRYPITSADLTDTVLLVELYDASTGGLPPLAPGTFGLATPPDDDLATCQHCVYLAKPRPDGTLDVSFFQVAGTMQVRDVSDPFTPVFSGDLTAELHAATSDANSHVTFVPDGSCRRVAGVSFDTSPVDAACTTLTDCPNELLQVCDPTTQRCVAPQCDLESGGCAATETCVPQLASSFSGACYTLCDPGVTGACALGFTCRQSGPQPDVGSCLRDGPGSTGVACDVEDASTSCTTGLACSAESGTCTAACRLFDAAPGCDPATRCSLFGRCEPPSAADPAPVGGPCAATASLASACAADAVGFQGYCFAFRDADPLRCVEACLDDGDCTPQQFCATRFSSGLGECLPDPVCGDGVVGEVGEVCDDGNTTSGDTCSADCQTVDYVRSCAAARPIVSGQSLAGDTRTALDGFEVSCQGGRARTELYRFAPATPGRLSVTVDGASTSSVAVLASCGASPTEVACAIGSPPTATALVTQLTTSAPVTISVGAFNVLEEGPHTIRVDFVPEVCGDGIVAGREVCDDGNAASGDGCSGDCRTIEYGVICALATPLSVTAPNTGTTVGAPNLYDNSCSAPVTGGDRIYTFTAPTTGTLTLSLDQGVNDLGLAVFAGCGAPAGLTELACSSVLGPNEEAQVALAAGERVTVVVDGFGPLSAGPYSLAAAFQ